MATVPEGYFESGVDESQLVDRSPRILIVRLSAIGDLVHTLPLACALRDLYPDSLITWVSSRPAAHLLYEHPAVDRVITVPRRYLRSLKMVLHLRKRLRALRFDMSFDAQSLSKSSIVAWLSGAKRRFGFGKPWGREISPLLNNNKVHPPIAHAIDRHLVMAMAAGSKERPPVRYDLPELAEDAERADEAIAAVHDGGPFVLTAVGAAWASKCWPTDRYAAVARYLGERYQMPMLLAYAGETEERMSCEIVEGSNGWAKMPPFLTLRQLAAVARRATFFLGSDSGPLHLAVAAGAPCVGLYGPYPAKLHGPYGDGHIALQKADFTGSTRDRRHAPPEIMEAITIDDVCQACDQIIHSASSRTPWQTGPRKAG